MAIRAIRAAAESKGVWLMLAGILLALITGSLTAINDAFAVFLLVPLLCFVAGFVRLLYGHFLEGRTPRLKRDSAGPQFGTATPGQPGTNIRAPQLQPAGATPVEDFTVQRWKTAEMGQAHSVTENTTRLLDE